jgi:hypothetical protein
VKLDERNVAAHGMLTDAYLAAGRFEEYMTKLAELGDMPPATDLDSLFRWLWS